MLPIGQGSFQGALGLEENDPRSRKLSWLQRWHMFEPTEQEETKDFFSGFLMECGE